MRILKLAAARAVQAITMAATCVLPFNPQAHAAQPTTWVATWTASPQAAWGGDFPLPLGVPAALQNQTLRQTLRVSRGGKRVRIVLSNAYGNTPLDIGAAHIAATGEAPGSIGDKGLSITFGGQKNVTIPPGAPLVSDPVDLPVAALMQLTISLYLPNKTPLSTLHWDGLQAAQIAAGNQASRVTISSSQAYNSRFFLAGVLVEAPAGGPLQSVVVLGDSITDGAASTPGANHRWPDFLARRLANLNVAVLNAGISGARLLKSFMGDNALARLDRDVLAQPGVGTLVVLMGINDIGWPGSSFEPQEPAVGAEALIAAYRQLIARAHGRGIRVVGATLTPFKGALTMKDSPVASYYSPDKDAIRQQVNEWLRRSGEFDAVLDFDAVVRDPQDHLRLLLSYDSGDHLHLSDAGNQAVADAVDLDRLFSAP